MEDKIILSSKLKLILLIALFASIFIFFLGIIIERPSYQHIWCSLLTNNIFFLFLALSGILFLALHNIAWSGWHVIIMRIPMAISSFLPVSAVFFLLMLFGLDSIFEWTNIAYNDYILLKKTAYLNVPFFTIRTVVCLAIWLILSYLLKSYNYKMDEVYNLSHFNKTKLYSALFLVSFAITQAVFSWDWIMSIDAHWFSTLFSWYVFIGILVSGISCIILFLYYLIKQHDFKLVTKAHLHDLGKYVFGFSIFWMYLWYFQYMLIWYGHIPEETIYYTERLYDYPILFFTVPVLCFLFPLLALMTRDSKRNLNWLAVVSIVVIIGQWMNVYLMVTPGVLSEYPDFGLSDIGLALSFCLLFIIISIYSLAKKNIICRNHPYFQESANLH
ncbi:MAG: hypothetical protein N4A49_16110 [Marinifilaceae bacterium]|jgi:hypothetical protein|nr:hypothetical protein [Marinifilaceae bacterium]